MPLAARLAPGILLGAVVVGAALLRLVGLGEQSYWYDELATLNVTSAGFPDLLDAVKASEATPPAYYFVAKVWRELFGDGEAVLRLLSAASGIAIVPVVYAAARRRICLPLFVCSSAGRPIGCSTGVTRHGETPACRRATSFTLS